MRITNNFTMKELVYSDTAKRKGIDNTPKNHKHTENLIYVTEKILQPIRDHFGEPIRVTSGYRSPELNRAVGGSNTSFHAHGNAVDIEFLDETDYTIMDIFDFVYNNLEFTELILEHAPNGWVHVAIAKGRENEKAIKYKPIKGGVRRSSYANIQKYWKESLR